jgi:NADPH-dependent 7-cyano-7-deazaguanine reductase QueF
VYGGAWGYPAGESSQSCRRHTRATCEETFNRHQKFRERDLFQEEAVNAILDEVVTSCDPVYCQVVGVFNVRGGMSMSAVADHGSEPAQPSNI